MMRNAQYWSIAALALGIALKPTEAQAQPTGLTTAMLRNNPNTVPTGTNLCWYVPRTLNAGRGDIVLSSAPDSVLTSLMSSIDQFFTHNGVALSSSRIRHSTFHASTLSTTGRIGLWAPHHFLGSDVRNGLPGLFTQSVDSAYVKQEFFLASGLVLAGAHPERRIPAADMVEQFQSFYRLYAYTDITWRNPFARSAGDGNMCSGTAVFADFLAGEQNFWFTVPYDAALRAQAAQAFYTAVRRQVIDGVNGFQKFATLDANIREFASNAANQFVNCMAFDDCANTGTRWRNGVGEGNTISPDNLVFEVLFGILASQQAGVENPFNYNNIFPLSVSSSWACCSNTRTNVAVCG